MEKATFYLPCPSRNGDEYPPSFEGYYDPSHKWNGWVGNPLFTREIYDKIVEYSANEEFNTEEDISIKEEMIQYNGSNGVDFLAVTIARK